MRSVSFTTSVLCLAGSLLAQGSSMTLRGELDEGRSTGCYYCPNVPYTVKYSETPVRSSVVDLQFYKDLSVPLILTGNWNTTTTPPGLDVTSVQVTSQSLGVSNTARTGQPLRFTTSGVGGDLALVLVAFGNGFLPAFDTALLIDPGSALLLGMNVLDSGGGWRFDLPIPDDQTLVGVRFWSQGAIAPAAGLPYTTGPQRTLIDR